RVKDLILVFLKIGSIGFGGGVGMLSLIRKYIIVDKKWITDDDLAKAVTLGQMIPGPFLPNYVEYIGYRLRGIKGMVASVIAFLLPGIVSIIILSYFYTSQIVLINQIFYWIQPMIIGILAWASFDMARLYLKDIRMIFITVIALIGNLIKIEPIFIILGCGVIGIILSSTVKNRLLTILPYLIFSGTKIITTNFKTIGNLFFIFIKIGAVIWGGGYAAIPFINQEVVVLRQMLTNQEFLSGIALSQITPGPVAIIATFVGYKVAGILGAIIATIAIFLPSFIILLIILKVYDYLKTNISKRLVNVIYGFLDGVKPAIVGFLISATIFLAIGHNVLLTENTFISVVKIILAILSFILLISGVISPLWLILIGTVIGIIWVMI
ncbi:MAG: chromate efflux transporter, partial [candidate division WOR-3 bacterium]